MPISNYGAALAAQSFLGKSLSIPNTLYVAVMTASPNATSTGVSLNEPTGGSYARVAVTNNSTNFTFDGYNAVYNATDIIFPVATGFWGRLGYWALVDAATSGNVMAYGTLNPVATVVSGDRLTIVANSLSIAAFAPENR